MMHYDMFFLEKRLENFPRGNTKVRGDLRDTESVDERKSPLCPWSLVSAGLSSPLQGVAGPVTRPSCRHLPSSPPTAARGTRKLTWLGLQPCLEQKSRLCSNTERRGVSVWVPACFLFLRRPLYLQPEMPLIFVSVLGSESSLFKAQLKC